MSSTAIKNFLLRYGFVIVLLLIVAIYSLSASSFLTTSNWLSMMHAFAPTLIMITGLSFVILTGAIDFSVGSIAFLAGQIGIYLMVMREWPPVVVLPLMVICGALIGLVNGVIVEVFKVNPLITTFGTMLVFRGLGYLVAGAKYIPIPREMAAWHSAQIGPIYADIVISFLLVVLLYFVQTRTIFGKHVMAVGSNREHAVKLGVNTRKIAMLAFVISGLFAGLGAIFYMIQGGYMTPRMGQGLEFTGVAIVVIGGISLFGGEGSVLSLLLGIFTISIIENGLDHLGLSPYLYPFLRGAIIFIAMYADSLKNRIRHTRVIQT